MNNFALQFQISIHMFPYIYLKVGPHDPKLVAFEGGPASLGRVFAHGSSLTHPVEAPVNSPH